MKLKKIVLYGVFPPNIGGVSTHISRLFTSLKNQDIDAWVLINNYKNACENYPNNTSDISLNNIRSVGGRIRKLKFFRKTADIYHLHGSLVWDYIYVFFLTILRKQNVVFTVHDSMQIRPSILYRFLLYSIYKIIPKRRICFIAVSALIKKQLIAIKIPESRIEVIPAFIQLPASIPHIPLIKASGYPIILAYAPGYVNDEQEVIYGIKPSIEAFKSIVNKYQNAHLVLCFPNGFDLPRLMTIIRDFGLNEASYTILSTPITNMSDLLMDVDIYMRLTSTDGDSNLIREALASGCMVVASDVVERPKGCHICSLKKIEDVTTIILQALDSNLNKISESNKTIETFKSITEVYETKFKKNTCYS